VNVVAVVFAGGDPPGELSVADLPGERFVIAADSGLDHALALGVEVDVLVGDLDSVSPASLSAAREAGMEIREHPTDKDETDLELALALAAEVGSASVVVIGAHGGRVDHWLGNMSLLASSRFAAMRIEARADRSRVYVVRDRVDIEAEPGQHVSLIPWHGPATGVTTEGLRWALERGTLDSGSTRGISNELTGSSASVSVEEGVLLVVVPGHD
jgi:thiamine pyrophosphokinase